MIKKGIIIIIVLGLGVFSMAQTSIQDIAREIISNNLSIQALSLENQMKELDDKSNLIPDDPELVGAYLWGSPSFIGNRTNLNAHQKIKFPTYYAKQKVLNNLSTDLYNNELELAVNEVLFEILDILVDLASINRRQDVLKERLDRLVQISELARMMLDVGETNRIEVEKASLLVDTYKQDLLLLESERKVLQRSLRSLNSDQPLSSAEPQYSDIQALWGALDNSDPLMNNLAIGNAELKSNMASADIELAMTGFLPDLQLGYVSEAINSDKLAGVEMGISIPLWGKPNQVKRAKLHKELSDMRLALTSQIIRSDWDNMDEISRQSLEIKENLEASLSSMKTKDLLEKSWQLGEISLLDYLKELPFYYGVEDRVVEAEKQYNKAILGKNKYHLYLFLQF